MIQIRSKNVKKLLLCLIILFDIYLTYSYSDLSFLYVGTNDGRVVRIQTNDDNFSNSPFDALQVTNQRLSTLEVDSLRGFLYATTAGSSRSEPAVVYKIDLTSWSDRAVARSRRSRPPKQISTELFFVRIFNYLKKSMNPK